MANWVEHFGLDRDPFDENGGAWSLFYGGGFGLASLELERALERKRGVVVLTGPAATGKTALLRVVLGRIEPSAVAAVSAAHATPASVLDVLLRSREPFEDGFSATRKRAALLALIEQAHASRKPVVCIVEDAHYAGVGQLHDLISAFDLAPGMAEVFQLVLVGRPALRATLAARSLASLRERVIAEVETAPLPPAEIAEFLSERLEAAGILIPDLILPPVTLAAIAHHSHGAIGLAIALAQRALERAAETASDCVSVEHVEEVADVLGSLRKQNERTTHGARRRSFAFGALAAIVTLALVVAAAEVHLLGSGGERIRANIAALRSLAGLDASGELELAQLGTPREEFLGDRSGHQKDGPSQGGAQTPYEVEIKPPPPPPAGANEPEAGETVITVPGIPGPLIPPATDSAAARNAPADPSVAPSGPRIALQVGAFRERKSAEALKEKLSADFRDVYISTVHSGGEPLYRVRIGRFSSPAQTEPLKAKLQAAGYPSFRVTESE